MGSYTPETGFWSYFPQRWLYFLAKLFLSPKFFIHRIAGAIYLLQYIAVFYLYFFNYPLLIRSGLTVTLPITGFVQSVIAARTFTFLPKKNDNDPGYYSDKSTLSYPFVVENSFFSLIALFQWVYYRHDFYYALSTTPLTLIENLFTFMPYAIRPFWPKTHFRNSLKLSDKNKSSENRGFFIFVTWVTKVFYIWAKHYIGYFLNYVRFLNRVTEEQRYHIFLLMTFGAFATTISMFLHTLKFKKHIGPRTSYLVYMASYLATFYSFVRIWPIFFVNLDLTFICAVGLVLNFSSFKVQMAYQVMVMVLLNCMRAPSFANMLPEAVAGLNYTPPLDSDAFAATVSTLSI